MNMRVLIVDDEPLARNRLRKLLAHEEDLEIIGECGNGPDAITCIQKLDPDLIFLDVQMPEVSGFDVLRAAPSDALRAVIFVTAHDRHAVEAFEARALDYLLKPFTKERLLDALGRAREHLQARDLTAANRQLQEWLKSPRPESAYLNRIAVKNGNQTVFVKIVDLDYIESASNYAVLHTASGNHILRETLTNLETRLPPKLFLRISRSVIVNLDKVKGLQSNPGGEYLAILQDDRQLAMTRGLREVQERLEYS